MLSGVISQAAYQILAYRFCLVFVSFIQPFFQQSQLFVKIIRISRSFRRFIFKKPIRHTQVHDRHVLNGNPSFLYHCFHKLKFLMNTFPLDGPS
ncbi:hypothetical protein D3C85_1575630 [compost metagenome]